MCALDVSRYNSYQNGKYLIIYTSICNIILWLDATNVKNVVSGALCGFKLLLKRGYSGMLS